MHGGRAVQRIRTTFFSGWNLFVFHLPLLCSLLNLDFPFQLRSYVAWMKNRNIVNLVTLFICKPVDTETSAFLLCFVEINMPSPDLFFEDIYYLAVDDNATKTRFSDDFLDDCRKGRFAIALLTTV